VGNSEKYQLLNRYLRIMNLTPAQSSESRTINPEPQLRWPLLHTRMYRSRLWRTAMLLWWNIIDYSQGTPCFRRCYRRWFLPWNWLGRRSWSRGNTIYSFFRMLRVCLRKRAWQRFSRHIVPEEQRGVVTKPRDVRRMPKPPEITRRYPIWWQRGPFFCPGTHRLTL
jgi:hypothetical protein